MQPAIPIRSWRGSGTHDWQMLERSRNLYDNRQSRNTHCTWISILPTPHLNSERKKAWINSVQGEICTIGT